MTEQQRKWLDLVRMSKDGQREDLLPPKVGDGWSAKAAVRTNDGRSRSLLKRSTLPFYWPL